MKKYTLEEEITILQNRWQWLMDENQFATQYQFSPEYLIHVKDLACRVYDKLWDKRHKKLQNE